MTTRSPTLTGVLGFPVGHSRSPAMMTAAFRELGLDWRYLKLPVAAERFEEALRALPWSGYRGANVTVPHKPTALRAADRASAAARAIGAANSLSFEDGAIVADNTDAGGFLDALGPPPPATRAVVLGAGGAARAVAWALRGAGAEVAVWNRTPERARELARALDVEPVRAPRGGDVLVNATTVGLHPDLEGEAALAELGLSGVEPPATVVDLVYSDRTTPVCAWAMGRAERVVDGLEVLVHQGARSLRAWTGCEPPIAVMRAAARAGEKRR